MICNLSELRAAAASLSAAKSLCENILDIDVAQESEKVRKLVLVSYSEICETERFLKKLSESFDKDMLEEMM